MILLVAMGHLTLQVGGLPHLVGTGATAPVRSRLVSAIASSVASGLSLAPFRALRPAVDGDRLGRLLCPPYDVIDEPERERLLETDPDNAVGIILPRGEGGADAYSVAARRLDGAVASGLYAVDPDPALYVYEMHPQDGVPTRGLLGAIELRDPSDGVILPHENTMPGPLADRLALMTATQADVEPIYLVYDGGQATSQLVSDVDATRPLAASTTPDGMRHRLWRLADPEQHAAVAADLGSRHALIADGHHRYATYLRLQHDLREQHGPGPWDRGLALLVDSSSYGPQVEAIHRVLVGLPLPVAVERAREACTVRQMASTTQALDELSRTPGFAAVLTDGAATFLLSDLDSQLAEAALAPGEARALAELDVTVLHRVLITRLWQLDDTVEAVGFAHSVEEAIAEADRSRGTAVLLRPTPAAAVAAVAAAGGRMPRKSTLFTPKPASGLVMRRFVDQT
jgi:uncharacterized protein (DUF1015 family)